MPLEMTTQHEAISRAIGGVLFNVNNFPEQAQPHLLGRNMSHLRETLTEAVLNAIAKDA